MNQMCLRECYRNKIINDASVIRTQYREGYYITNSICHPLFHTIVRSLQLKKISVGADPITTMTVTYNPIDLSCRMAVHTIS